MYQTIIKMVYQAIGLLYNNYVIKRIIMSTLVSLLINHNIYKSFLRHIRWQKMIVILLRFHQFKLLLFTLILYNDFRTCFNNLWRTFLRHLHFLRTGGRRQEEPIALQNKIVYGLEAAARNSLYLCKIYFFFYSFIKFIFEPQFFSSHPHKKFIWEGLPIVFQHFC